VLPVLALKLFALAEHAQRAHSDRVVHVAAYGAGVLASMLVLASCVIALRAAGVAVGWGFQLQEPVFVAALAMLMVAFAMNLFGLFETGTPRGLEAFGRSATGWQRSFFDGLLLVVLATPCSAPFLGTAVGFAFASPSGWIVAVFAAIGAGLALPFAGVALVPGAARLLPRPGPWMEELRRVLGFALLATAAWLLWVLGRAAGIDAATALLVLLLGVSFGCWVYGGIQRSSHPSLRRAAALGLIAFCGLGLAALSGGIPAPPTPDTGSSRKSAGGMGGFDPAEVAAQLERGRPAPSTSPPTGASPAS
jgi:thiol:disulfide interchange protein DsbD